MCYYFSLVFYKSLSEVNPLRPTMPSLPEHIFTFVHAEVSVFLLSEDKGTVQQLSVFWIVVGNLLAQRRK